MSDGDRAMQLRADQLVLRECDDHGILRLTLNDPKTRNSLSEDDGCACAALADAGDDAAVRVIVLAANGPVFCAGHNLKEMTAARTDPQNGGDRAGIFHACDGSMFSPDGIIFCASKTYHCRGCSDRNSCRLPAGGQL